MQAMTTDRGPLPIDCATAGRGSRHPITATPCDDVHPLAIYHSTCYDHSTPQAECARQILTLNPRAARQRKIRNRLRLVSKAVPTMLLIGLTGSIATGKSTVSSLLSAPPYALPIIDADVLARRVVEPGTAGYAAIVAHFGPSTPDLLVPVVAAADAAKAMPEAGPDGKGRPLNRAVLGRRVFGDDAARRRDRAVLNGIVHPAVRREMYKALLRCYLRGCRAVVLDVPLLFESRLDRLCGAVVVVAVRDPATQMARLRARDPHLSADEAEGRVASQADVRGKARRCEARGPGRGAVVWNDAGREELNAELARAVGPLLRSSPGWWSWVLLLCPPLGVAAGAWAFWRNTRINKRWEEAERRERANL